MHSRAAAVQPEPRELHRFASARSRAEVPLAAQLREPGLPVFVVSAAREAHAIRVQPKRESPEAETAQLLASPVALALARTLACRARREKWAARRALWRSVQAVRSRA